MGDKAATPAQGALPASTEDPTIAPAQTVQDSVNIVAVQLREAALDSPSFRAASLHFLDQVELVERWLEGCLRSLGRFSADIANLDGTVTGMLACLNPPTSISDAVLDHDYPVLAAQRHADAAREMWGATLTTLKKLESNVAEPFRVFLHNDMRSIKDARRQFEHTQRTFDAIQSRYAAQNKSKEASAMREDAFQLHEMRKAYLKASSDFAVAAPQFRQALNKLLIRAFYDQTTTMRNAREGASALFSRILPDVDRTRSWLRELEASEKVFRRELTAARRHVESVAEAAARPSRDLDNYALSAPTAKQSRLPLYAAVLELDPSTCRDSKQGWLNLKTVVGKPSRTVWSRRWFYLDRGVFGWLILGPRSGGVEESDRIGVLLCGVRAAVSEERRYTFEVKTKDMTMVLQAEHQLDVIDWMDTFQNAKQKAVEAASSTDAAVLRPPIAPELAARTPEAAAVLDEGSDKNALLPVSSNAEPGSLAPRGSFDVAGRRPNASDFESSREQAARIMQKLDIHRKPIATAAASSSTATPTGSNALPGGIASLISASSMALPIGMASVPGTASSDQAGRAFSLATPAPARAPVKAHRETAAGSLGPPTLAGPPSFTGLSAVAASVAVERDLTSQGPGGLLANTWGSFDWTRMQATTLHPREPASEPSLLRIPPMDNVPPYGSVGQFTAAENRRSHRKTVSLDGDIADMQRSTALTSSHALPKSYPAALRQHEAQFRLLFPDAPADPVAVVFRASWKPNEQVEFPGRAYVTQKDLYFYSNHLGLTLTAGISLERIFEVTAVSGRDYDALHLHVRESERNTFNRLILKTFLEPYKILQRRLNCLIRDAEAEEPQGLEILLKSLVKFELGEPDAERSSSVESGEGSGELTRIVAGDPSNPNDKSTAGEGGIVRQGSMRQPKDSAPLKLPSKPVHYVPRGFATPVVEKKFQVSPKALFHVLFGDRSMIWQLLHRERLASRIQQSPWTLLDDAHQRRLFHYTGRATGWLGQEREQVIEDSQTIDVLSDHLCYVVTNRQTPWQLPCSTCFQLVTKVVITYESKSLCRLSVYGTVDWRRQPWLVTPLLQQKAMEEIQLEALLLMSMASEQVRRLGPYSQTKKAVNVFGQIGQQVQSTELAVDEAAVPLQTSTPQRTTLAQLVAQACLSFAESAVSLILLWVAGTLRWLWKISRAHVILLSLLAASSIIHFWSSSQVAADWWRDRRATQYMRRLGVVHDMAMSHEITISDLETFTTRSPDLGLGAPNACSSRFESFSSFGDPAPASIAPSLRMRKTQARMRRYRHDLAVALRVVSRVEQELLQSYWEDWVRAEVESCSQVRESLQSESTRNASLKVDYERLQARLDEYCTSCEAAAEQIKASPRVGSALA